MGVASASSARLPLELRTLGTQQSFKTTARHQRAAPTRPPTTYSPPAGGNEGDCGGTPR